MKKFPDHSTFDFLVNSTGMKIPPKKLLENLSKIITKELSLIADSLNKSGFEVRIAGGAVRDLLQDILPSDIDLATTATPNETKTALLKDFQLYNSTETTSKENTVRFLNLNGEGHGTVTARINETNNYEITTLRIDEETDGRHAIVKFTNDWKLDASRRDLTINSMFVSLNGELYDYFDGENDLEKNFIQFVGNAEERIQEDYLRILRYFRFVGKLSTYHKMSMIDFHTMETIKRNSKGLLNISGERIWIELEKLVKFPYADEILRMMSHCNIFQYIGLNQQIEDFSRLTIVYQNCKRLEPMGITILTSLLDDEKDLKIVENRLKFSGENRKTALTILRFRKHIQKIVDERADLDELINECRKLMVEMKYDKVFGGCHDLILKNRLMELIKCTRFMKSFDLDMEEKRLSFMKNLLERIKSITVPSFPLTGHHLSMLNIPRGKVYEIILRDMRNDWLLSNFQLDLNSLLEKVEEKYIKSQLLTVEKLGERIK
ncbi:hypothetical protein SNEBB_004911 [Seison nebaliae]|nr:hypothetical protein SNEBB_004911 [Seison nebaliae]